MLPSGPSAIPAGVNRGSTIVGMFAPIPLGTASETGLASGSVRDAGDASATAATGGPPAVGPGRLVMPASLDSLMDIASVSLLRSFVSEAGTGGDGWLVSPATEWLVGTVRLDPFHAALQGCCHRISAIVASQTIKPITPKAITHCGLTIKSPIVLGDAGVSPRSLKSAIKSRAD